MVLEVVPRDAGKRRWRGSGIVLGQRVRELLPGVANVPWRVLEQDLSVSGYVGEHDRHGAGQRRLRPVGGRVGGDPYGYRAVGVDRDRGAVA